VANDPNIRISMICGYPIRSTAQISTHLTIARKVHTGTGTYNPPSQNHPRLARKTHSAIRKLHIRSHRRNKNAGDSTIILTVIHLSTGTHRYRIILASRRKILKSKVTLPLLFAIGASFGQFQIQIEHRPMKLYEFLRSVVSVIIRIHAVQGRLGPSPRVVGGSEVQAGVYPYFGE
jgi:hypothetical protein